MPFRGTWYTNARKSTATKRPWTKKKKKSKKTSPSLVRTIKKVVARGLEKKEATYNASISGANAINTNFALNVNPLTPATSNLSIVQGVTQGTRIGNEITATKATLRLMMFINPYNVSSFSVPIPQGVEIFIFSVKGESQALANARTICASSGGSFFQNGASALGFSGNNLDHMYQPNIDQVTVYYHKYVKLGPATMSTNTGAQANAYLYANNDYKLNQSLTIDLLKHGFPKHLKFEDNGAQTTSRQLFFVVSPWDCDGGAAIDTTASVPINFDYMIDLKYTDA